MSAAALLAAGGAPGIINPSIPGASAAVTCTAQLKNDGTYANDTLVTGNWVTPASAFVAALYEVKVDVTSGSFTGGSATGSYLSLGTSRSWTRTGLGTVTYTVTIREIATGVVRSVQAGKTLVVTV